MGQNNDTREQGDPQGQQDGQMGNQSGKSGQGSQTNPQDQQRQAQKSGMPDDNNAGGKQVQDKTANQGTNNNNK
jgi:hypothetical protein